MRALQPPAGATIQLSPWRGALLASVDLGTPNISVAAPATPVKTKLRRMLTIVLLVDLIVIVLSLYVAWSLREGWGLSIAPFAHHARRLADTAWIPPLWLSLLAVKGAYSPRLFGGGPEEFKMILMGSLATACTVGTACYLLQNDLSRRTIVTTFAIATPLLLLERYGIRKVVHRLRDLGHLIHRVIAVGGPSAIAEVIDILHRERYVGYEIVGACVPNNLLTPDFPIPVPIVGTPEVVRVACDEASADTVLVTGGSFSSSADLRRVGWQLERSKIDLIVLPSLADVAGPRIHLRPVAGLPLMHVEPPQADEAGRWSKRLFDIAGAVIGIVLCLPVIALAALAVKMQDGGPVVFRQTRVGRGGSPFECLKLRSMCVKAEDRLAEVAGMNECDGLLFKIQGDPRITSVGRFLRRFSIDELPQLFNVLRGEMSLVGPRPPLATEVSAYTEDVRRRLLVRPGMTGLWQVSGRSQLSWRESVRLDLYYVDNWSMIGDLVILAKTFRAVITSRGAY
jgi:exopolysaccharide biosynthesis polyprenyl glycosylphosphotransferase